MASVRTTFLLLAASLVPPALPAQEALHAELSQVQTVYLLPMSNGLEQYIANHINRLQGRSCDPKAGVVFTDMISDLERVADHAINIAYSLKD